MSGEKIEQTFPVTTPARLKLSNIRGAVEIVPGDSAAIAICAVKEIESGDAESTEIILEQLADGSVRAETRFKEQWLGWFSGHKPCRVIYTVQAPASCAVQLNCVSADARVRGLQGDFEASMVSGDLLVEQMSGNLNVRTVSGDIRGRQNSGIAKLSTVSGNIVLADSNLERVNANTVSGDIHLHTPLGEGPYHFSSVSGDVRLALADAAPLQAQLSTISGRLRAEMPAALARENGKQYAVVGSGGAKISMSSVSGNLLVGLAAGAPLNGASAPAQPPAAHPDRADTIARLERGEINVEQALALLR